MADRLAAVAASSGEWTACSRSWSNLPSPTGVATMTTTITGVDGNDIALYITHPIPAAGELPGVYFHGGGMGINSATD